jgi:para-nitrobenzyl esterase
MVGMRILPTAVAAALLSAACAPQPAPGVFAHDSLRTLKPGRVVGVRMPDGTHAWRGIPFAEPPVGERRWRAPAPVTAWSGILHAQVSGNPCPQFASPLGGVPGDPGEIVGSEDCLTLDVYAPRLTPAAVTQTALPVMVWLHGGGNSIGTARNYYGGALAKRANVIVVAVQYRLGPLGWFRHAALRAGASPEEASGNFGTLDQIAALRWVQDNVAAFGGDPGNVTVFGESAGGRNTLAMLVSPLARGLFHRAIDQSGALACSTAAEAENDAAAGGQARSSAELVKALAAAGGATAPAGPAAAAYLRGTSAAALLAVSRTPGQAALLLYPQTFADGVVLPADCDAGFARAGGWNRVPVIVGANRDEARLFLFANPQYVKRRFGLIPRYVVEPEVYLATAYHASRGWRFAMTDDVAARLAAGGGEVYVYRFEWNDLPTVFGADLAAMLGASHGFEIPFVFGNFDLGPESARLFTDDTLASRLALSQKMMDYWGAFARHGTPGAVDGVAWAPWTAAAPQRIVFDTPAGGGVRMKPGADSMPAVVAAVRADPVLDGQAKCRILLAFAQRGAGFDQAQYEALTECRDLPYRPRSEP